MRSRWLSVICATALVLGGATLTTAQEPAGEPSAAFTLKTGGLFNRLRGAVGDAPYRLEVNAEGAGGISIRWDVDELASDNPGDMGHQEMIFITASGEQVAARAPQVRREAQRSEDGSVYAYEEVYIARFSVGDLQVLASSASTEMRIRGKTFKLGASEQEHFARVAAFAAAPPAGTDLLAALVLAESAPAQEPALGKQAIAEPLLSPVWPVVALSARGGPRYTVTAQTVSRPEYVGGQEPAPIEPVAPYLAVGDSVSLFLSNGVAKRVPVKERIWGVPGENAYCSVLLDPAGWAYFLPVEDALFPASYQDTPPDAVALPVAFQDAREIGTPSGAPRDSIVAYFQRAYADTRASDEENGHVPDYAGPAHTPHALRDMLDYDRGWASWDGPAGRMHMLSASLMDDYSDHGMDTWITFLVDDSGREVARNGGRYSAVGSADLNGDGVPELILRQGVVYSQGDAWILPEPKAGEFCD